MGIFYSKSRQKRKNGQETRNTPSVRGICVNFDLWWDTVRCAEMWASEHFPRRNLRCARASERGRAQPSSPPQAWLASCPDTLVTPLYLPQMYQTNDQNHRPRTETNTQHLHGSLRRAGEVYRRQMANSLTRITTNEELSWSSAKMRSGLILWRPAACTWHQKNPKKACNHYL